MKSTTGSQYLYFSAPLSTNRDPLSDFIEGCSLTLKMFGWQCEENVTCGPRIYGDMELIYVLSGESIITLNGTVYHGHSGDLFVIQKHSLCRIETNPNDPHENYWMHLDIGDLVSEKQFQNLLGGPLLHLGKDSLLLEYYRWLDACYTIGGSGSYLSIKCYLQLILIRIIQLSQNPDSAQRLLPAVHSDSRRDLLQRTMHMIVESRGNTSVANLCKQLYVSPAHLRQVFRSLLGESPSIFIRAARIREAEILLMTTDLLVSSIAEQLGYASPYHFTSDFRKHHAIAPSEYRKIHRNTR